jgi:hypothetical protein
VEPASFCCSLRSWRAGSRRGAPHRSIRRTRFEAPDAIWRLDLGLRFAIRQLRTNGALNAVLWERVRAYGATMDVVFIERHGLGFFAGSDIVHGGGPLEYGSACRPSRRVLRGAARWRRRWSAIRGACYRLFRTTSAGCSSVTSSRADRHSPVRGTLLEASVWSAYRGAHRKTP